MIAKDILIFKQTFQMYFKFCLNVIGKSRIKQAEICKISINGKNTVNPKSKTKQ